MRLSVSNKLRGLLDTLGVVGKDPFPTVVSDDWRVVWPKFLNTKAAKQLQKTSSALLGRFRVSAAFVSYITSIDPTHVWRDGSVNILEELNSIDITDHYAKIRSILHRKGFSRLIKSKDVQDVTVKDVDFIRALVHPTFTGSFVLTPKGRVTLEQFLRSIVPTTFSIWPPEFDKQPKYSSLLQQRIGWVPIYNDKSLDLYVGRASLNMLVFKYEIRSDEVVFYGDSSAAEAQKYLNKFKETI